MARPSSPFSLLRQVVDTGAAAPLGRSSRGDVFGTLLVPLHYEPEYQYPLVVWADSADESSGETEGALRTVSLTEAMMEISLRNFAGVSARPNPGHSPYPPHTLLGSDLVRQLVATARTKLNVHPDRIFVVLRGPASFAAEFLMRTEVPLAGVVWIAPSVPGPDSRTPSVPAAPQRATRILLEVADRPALIEAAKHQAHLLHARGWEPEVIASRGGEPFLKTALANANRWMMGIVTGQPTLGVTPSAEPVNPAHFN